MADAHKRRPYDGMVVTAFMVMWVARYSGVAGRAGLKPAPTGPHSGGQRMGPGALGLLHLEEV